MLIKGRGWSAAMPNMPAVALRFKFDQNPVVFGSAESLPTSEKVLIREWLPQTVHHAGCC